MALPLRLSEREKDKFVSPASGNPVAVAVVNPDGTVISSSATVAIGSAATLYAVVNTTATAQASVVLDSGIRQIGSVTISNSPTLGVGTNYIGLASVNIGGSLPAGSNFIGLVSTASIRGDVNLATLISGEDQTNDLLKVAGNIASGSADAGNPVKVGGIAIPQEVIASTASGNRVNAWFDNQGRQAIFGNATIYLNSSIPTGTNYIGLATVNVGNNLTIGSNVTLNPSANYIGLASVNIGGTLPALTAGTNYIGLTTTVLSRSPILGVGDTTALFASTATGSLLNIGLMDRSGRNASIGGNTANTGLNTNLIEIGGNAVSAGNGITSTGTLRVTLSSDSTGVVTLKSQASVVLATGTNYVGLVSVNIGGTLPAGTNYIGLASVNVGGSLPAGSNFIGLVSTASINGRVDLATLISGEDQTNNVMMVENQFSYTALTSNSTVAVKASAGLLHLFNIGMPSCPTITFYDSATPSGTVLHKIGANYPMGSHLLDTKFTTGLSVDATAAGTVPQLVVSWR